MMHRRGLATGEASPSFHFGVHSTPGRLRVMKGVWRPAQSGKEYRPSPLVR
jgi:hypothetical protein